MKAHQIDFYETNGRNVNLYWRCLEPNAKKKVVLNLVVAIPGEYQGPASCAYLYYTDDIRQWVDGLKVHITHRE